MHTLVEEAIERRNRSASHQLCHLRCPDLGAKTAMTPVASGATMPSAACDGRHACVRKACLRHACVRQRAPTRRPPAKRGGSGQVARALIGMVVTAVLPAAASGHYKSATLSWERIGGGASRTVDITLRSAWSTEYTPFKEQVSGGVISVGQTVRILGLGNPVLFLGDGGESYKIISTKVVAVDHFLQVWRGEAIVRHTYPANLNYTAHFGGCCRDKAVANSAQGYFYVSTSVNLALNATRSPKIAVLPRQYLRAGWRDKHANSFVVGAYKGTYSNEAAASHVPSRKFSWSLADMVPASMPRMVQDTRCCNVSGAQDLARQMHLEGETGLVWGAADAGLYYMLVGVRDDESGAYAQVDFEVAVLDHDAPMPEFEGNFSQAILDIPAVNEVYATYSYDWRVRFLATGSQPLEVRLQFGMMPETVTLRSQTELLYTGGYKAYQSALRWAVAVEDVGWHVLCINAYTNETVPGIGAIASRTHCLEFDVTLDPPPRFARPTTALSHLVVYMGEDLHLSLVALDDNEKDEIAIKGQALPLGSVLSPVSKDPSVQVAKVEQNMSWVPQARSGGESGTFCFTASDVRGAQGGPGGGSAQVCYQYEVPKCLYRVRDGEAMVDVADKFGMSWLQLWSLNKDIRRPEGHGGPGALQEGYIIHIGQLVQVRSGDTLPKLAARFGTTLRQVLNLNKDITASQTLVGGQHVCLVPSSCVERQ
jgi:hypothetical protein